MQREQRRYLAPATTQIKAVSGRFGLVVRRDIDGLRPGEPSFVGAFGVRIGDTQKKVHKIGKGGIQTKGQKRIKKT
jgi:hypothetical protein